MIRSLIEDGGPRLLTRLGKKEWQTTDIFARTGFTAVVQARAAADGALWLNLPTIDADRVAPNR
mgnify:CR=1 FL=1